MFSTGKKSIKGRKSILVRMKKRADAMIQNMTKTEWELEFDKLHEQEKIFVAFEELKKL